MKAIGIVISLFLSTFIFAQDEDINQTDSNGEKHGKWVGYHESGNVRYIGNFEHGVPTGKFAYYYDETGIVQMVMEYRDATTIYATAFYELNGYIKMAEGLYVNQLKDSVWTFYDARGILSSKETFSEDKLNGERTVFYLDGSVYEISNWQDSVMHGAYVSYFENGQESCEGEYVEGCWKGRVTYYHTSGQVELQGYYSSCVPHGYWTQYDERGTEVDKKFYKYGVLLEGDEIQEYLDYLDSLKEDE